MEVKGHPTSRLWNATRLVRLTERPWELGSLGCHGADAKNSFENIMNIREPCIWGIRSLTSYSFD